MEQINITLGTAGHIDHGKTSLVKCLTGCETDRLKEEKERGMSIELGFAPCKIADKQVGIVDVPGHENFIKTMVAGASGMDAVLLVVAADDGVMPQTREHLDILTLLGVRHGLVALTKIDRVAPERRAGVCDDVSHFLRGTFLEGAPILPLSNVTGEGFDRFLESLWALVATLQPRRVDGIFRLPLERGFSVQGYGTVVAGIPVAGLARVGDEVVLLPHNTVGRIRRVEVYGQSSDTVMAGQCAAINVGHWDHHAIHRGDTLTLPGFFTPQSWFVCSLRLLQREKILIKSGAEVRFHTGTSDVAAMFYPAQGHRMESGDEGLIQIKTKMPVVAGPGDPFLLRTQSPVRTIGGGIIVEAIPERLKTRHARVYEDMQERAAAVVEERRFVEYCVRRVDSLVAGESELVVRTKIPARRMQEILAEWIEQKVIFALAGKLYVHRDTVAEVSQRIVDCIVEFHRQSPESPGITWDQLRQTIAIDKTLFDEVMTRLKSDGRLVEKNQRLAMPEHRIAFQNEDAKLLDALESMYREKLFSPPGVEEVAQRAGTPSAKTQKLLGILREHGQLVLVEGEMLFHREAVERAREIAIAHFQKEERLESVQFKYLLDTTRKFALPLLDHLDRIGVTRRVGNTRYLKRVSH